jgi:hypothetical protein
LGSARDLLRPGGVMFAAVPDAGSFVARTLGRRWWSVQHMHLHQFTRASLLSLLHGVGFAPVWLGTHPKVFTARYYAERLGGYARWLERAATGTAEFLHLDRRLVAPNLRDRVAVIATRR